MEITKSALPDCSGRKHKKSSEMLVSFLPWNECPEAVRVLQTRGSSKAGAAAAPAPGSTAPVTALQDCQDCSCPDSRHRHTLLCTALPGHCLLGACRTVLLWAAARIKLQAGKMENTGTTQAMEEIQAVLIKTVIPNRIAYREVQQATHLYPTRQTRRSTEVQHNSVPPLFYTKAAAQVSKEKYSN